MCSGGRGNGVNNNKYGNRPEYSNTAIDIYIINKIMEFMSLYNWHLVYVVHYRYFFNKGI